MKTKLQLLMAFLMIGPGWIPAGRVSAQIFTNLHSFTEFGIPNNSNNDGASPYAALVVWGNTLYGTASSGGMSSLGTVFAVNTDGTGFRTLHKFGGAGGSGASPQAELILSGDTLYGTAYYGGSQARGSVFKVQTNGTGFTTLYSFTYSTDGAYPYAGLVLAGSTLYGTTSVGGSFGKGTVFALNTDGTGLTNLHDFIAADDGAFPQGRLLLSGNILYGTANQGGSAGYGTVFALKTDGTDFTNLHSFGYGAYPRAGLILAGNTLFGTAQNGLGSVFAVKTDGTGFTNLHEFNYDEGYGPTASLILSGNTLYGTAKNGGLGQGTVFSVNIDGSGFTNLYSFTAVPQFVPYINSDGAHPFAAVVFSADALYGTAYSGGSAGNGTLFRISLPVTPNQEPPALALSGGGSLHSLTWPSSPGGFALQSTPTLNPPDWQTISDGISEGGGTNTYIVTNSLIPSARFFRLRLP